MALAHQIHRHGGRTNEDDEAAAYAAADVASVEGVAAGSVTSFVRKLFQMVQGECDSVVGFVADGTAFEVKDPRRLEQDILPKYFRHSRFQSLVRQLNFYSFKKISKERSVWIYKHAFFRRDEPELLHALKRKTNQHGARIGGIIGDHGEDIGAMERPRILSAPRSLSREVHDSKSRPRGPSSAPRHTPTFSVHNSPSSFSNHARQHQSRPPHLAPPANKSSRPHHTSNSRSAGGGPSTGGVGGAAAPCYGSGRGPLSRMSGFAWAGAGGRPVSAGGSAVSSSSGEYNRADGRNTLAPRGSLSHRCAGGGSSSGDSSSHGRPVPSSQAYRQGPAIGDSGDAEMIPFGGRSGGVGGVKRSPAATAAGGAGAAPVTSDREQALAMWGLSALCQVASATDAPSGEEGMLAGRRLGGGQFAADSPVEPRSPRIFEDGDRQRKRQYRGPDSVVIASRLGWGGGDRDGGNEEHSSDEEAEEDGITSAERDDSSASFRHMRNASNSSSSCDSSTSSRMSEGASSVYSSPAHSPTPHGDDVTVSECLAGSVYRHGDPAFAGKGDYYCGDVTVRRMSGSGGVFCQTWDWGRAACEPAIRLPESCVERRLEEVRGGVGGEEEGPGMAVDEDGYPTRTGGEDVRDFHADDRNGCDTSRAAQEAQAKASSSIVAEEGRAPSAPHPRDLDADMEAEAAAGLQGIGALFAQFCHTTTTASSVNPDDDSARFTAASDDGDSSLREMSVFCAGPAGRAPETETAAALAFQVSSFLRSEEAVAQDLRVYAEALDPAAADVVSARGEKQQQSSRVATLDSAKILRIFCRYAACRLGRALEVVTTAAGGVSEDTIGQGSSGGVVQRVRLRLEECRWKWWRAAVRFS